MHASQLPPSGHSATCGGRNNLVYALAGGVLGFLLDFELYIQILGVRKGPMGFIAPWRFKALDSQPVKSNMGPASIDFHDFDFFGKVVMASWPGIYSAFGSGVQKYNFRLDRSEPKSCATKICRFVVVSPREVHSSSFPCPFDILSFWYFSSSFPVSCLSPFGQVFTKFGHQP